MSARNSEPDLADGASAGSFRWTSVLQSSCARGQEPAGCPSLATRTQQGAVAGMDRGPEFAAAWPHGARAYLGDFHRPLDIPAADRRGLRADRSDLVASLQPRPLCRAAPRAAARTEPGCAAGRGPAAGHAQSLRSHGFADAAPGAQTLGASGGDRLAQR